MKQQTHQLFAQLCESVLAEASTTMDLIQGAAGGQQIVKFLHSKQGLAHDQNYVKAPKISWSELKDSYKGAWVILKYPKGTGAIKQRNGSYEAAASTGQEPETFQDSRGGNILDFLKQRLGGNPTAMYVGKEQGKVKDLKQKRKDLQTPSKASVVSPEGLVEKFRPLWVKAATAAIADIKGVVGTMIKNDSFDKASHKLNLLQHLTKALDDLETGEEKTPEAFREAVNQAILLAASHYYPEQTGNITKSYRGYNAERSEGQELLLKDIASGDTSKIGTILAFFKRSLISK
jgi:hypothetical protein